MASTLPPFPIARGSALTPLNQSCWGDSLTAGTGAIPGQNSYPTWLQSLLPSGSIVYNGGNPGDTSSQILTRFQADTAHKNNATVFWAGRNNYGSQSQVLSDVAAMVAGLSSPSRFLVMSVINSELYTEYSGQTNYNQIISLNQALQAAYPNNFLDIRAYLVSQYNPANAADVLDHQNDTVPHSLRSSILNIATVGASIAPTDQTITLNYSTGGIGNGQVVQIDNELIYILTNNGSNQITSCTRGYAGTTAASHTTASTVTVWDALHLSTAAYQLIAQQVYNWFQAHAAFPAGQALTTDSLAAIFASPPPIGLGVANAAQFSALTVGLTQDLVQGEAVSLYVTSSDSSHSSNLWLGYKGNTQVCGIQQASQAMGFISGGSYYAWLSGLGWGIMASNSTAASINARLSYAGPTVKPISSASGNGTSAPDIINMVGETGGATTGTTGQTAGHGGSVKFTAGTGGNAPSGSTNGAGGSVALEAGAAGSGAGTAASGGQVNLNVTSKLLTQVGGPIQLGGYTVATLPTTIGGIAIPGGSIAYASNGRKTGEGSGSGTGVPVYYSNGSWRVYSTDAAVAA